MTEPLKPATISIKEPLIRPVFWIVRWGAINESVVRYTTKKCESRREASFNTFGTPPLTGMMFKPWTTRIKTFRSDTRRLEATDSTEGWFDYTGRPLRLTQPFTNTRFS